MVERYNDNLAALNDFAVNEARREELTKFHDTVLEVNIPENLQCSERYVRAENAADALDSAMSSLEDVLDYIETAYAWHKLQEPEMVERYNANLASLNEIFENDKDSQKVNSVSDFAERYREEKDHSSAREL